MLLAVALAVASPPTPPQHMLLGDRVAVYATATDTVALAHVASVDGQYLEVAVVGREGDRVQVTSIAAASSCAGTPWALNGGTVSAWVRAEDAARVVTAAAAGAGPDGSWAVAVGTPAFAGKTGVIAVISAGVTAEVPGLQVAGSFPAAAPAPASPYALPGMWITADHALALGEAVVAYAAGAELTSTVSGSKRAPASVGVVSACGYVWASVPNGWLSQAGQEDEGGGAMAPPAPSPPSATERVHLRGGTPLYWPGGAPAGALTAPRDVAGLTEDGDRRCWIEPRLFSADLDATGGRARLCVAATDVRHVTAR